MGTVSLAAKYSPKVDERFTRQSQASLITNQDYDFTGVDTVNVYSVDTVAMNDYNKTAAANRYGTPAELGNKVQTLKLDKDRSWTFIIDKANKSDTMMVMDAGKACGRQISEVVIPEYDKYVFDVVAKAAFAHTDANGVAHKDVVVADTANAYTLFLHAQEVLGNCNVPDMGRVCLCSYAFANLMKQNPAFMRYGDRSQEMLIKGIMGEVDGTKIVKVPASRLPKGCSFIMAHKMATVAPKKLDEYKIHTDPQGISGWVCEGRIRYGAFVLDNKADALFYQGTDPNAMAAASVQSTGKKA